MKAERLLQSQGFGTRRECRALIRSGLFHFSETRIDDPFAELDITSGQSFQLGEETWPYCEKVYLALYKPAGFECSHKPLHHRSVFSLLPAQFSKRGVQCIGRLDQDTTGLLLMSDDGQFIHSLSSGKKNIPKIYEVLTRHPVTSEMLEKLLEGVMLHGESIPVKAQACEMIHERRLDLTISEGKYHQVKRMIAASGNRVEALFRKQINNLVMPENLQEGQWVWLDEKERAACSVLV